MYDINLKNVKKGRNFYMIFLIFGILFLVIFGAIFGSSVIALNKLDSTTQSTRVEVRSYVDSEGSTMYSPVYYYEVNGRQYSCSSNSSSSINPGTRNNTVYYDSNNPENCMTEYSKSSGKIVLLFSLLPILFIGIAVFNIIKINKRVKAIIVLNQTGKLVKNLPYRLENTGMSVNDVPIQRPVVDYTLPSGSTITLFGDPRHDRKHFDADGMVDIIIDENNPANYFIDFEINRLGGNLPQDYYNQNPPANNQVQSPGEYQTQDMSNQQYTDTQTNQIPAQNPADSQNINNQTIPVNQNHQVLPTNNQEQTQNPYYYGGYQNMSNQQDINNQ